MESIKDADYCLLVAEPTIFGLENLKMVFELTKVYGKQSGLVINKSNGNDELIEAFAKENQLPILGVIPFEKDLALANSNLEMVSDGPYRMYFEKILDQIKKVVTL
jgi:MinD superfamily P-loop ATPase